jgi:histidinol-phosphatase (PHP family)
MDSNNTPILHHSITPPVPFSDYHSHPQGHRVQPYTQALLQPWVDSARARGLSDIAFTDHDRYHGGIDFDEIDQLRAANPDMKIRAGIELDNDPETSAAGRAWVEKNWVRLDFVLGSVHYLDRPDQMFDSVPAGAEQFTGRDIDEIYTDYFRRIRAIAATGLVDCLSHLDLIKIHGHRPASPVRDLIADTLELIAVRGLAIELSTAGWRKPVNELYPSDEIIRLALEKGIRFTTASDAHSHVQLGENYDRLAGKMEALGIREVCVFENHRRQLRPL